MCANVLHFLHTIVGPFCNELLANRFTFAGAAYEDIGIALLR